MNRTNEFLMTLFDWIWQASAMAAVTVVLILLIQRVLQQRLKPRWQYLMWLLVIIRLMLPWSPESPFSIYNWLSYPSSMPVIDPTAYWDSSKEASVSESAGASLYRYCLYVWLLGISAFGTYTVVVNRKFALQITKETTPIMDTRVQQLFAHCQRLMSVHQPIQLVVSDTLTAPTLFGLVKPKLVMPQTVLNGLSEEQLRYVFLHELAHCKRNDIGINWLMQILLICHWFNPVLWYAYQRMREDQEIASDALALTYLDSDESRNYGYTLIQMLENYAQPINVPGNINLTGSKLQLQRRIMMIKQFKSNSYRWSFVGLAAIIIISGCSLTDAQVIPAPAQTSNLQAIDQKALVTTDTATVVTDTDKKPETSIETGTKTEATMPAAANEAAVVVTAPEEQKPAPTVIEAPRTATPSDERREAVTRAALNDKPQPVAAAPSAAPAQKPQQARASAAAPQERQRPSVSAPVAATVPAPAPAAADNNVRKPTQVMPEPTAQPQEAPQPVPVES
ncbi:M48 family metalloprotease [Paenibacillus sp. S3N08]|uniref:M48 family metalloprotease n=1 Tax=Paenibacillus agricola TaxID=2716264 RepID=A0ABX0J8K8_9BACL|nr:M48 family metalloprotease [Paenibacillus agricola]